MTPLRAYQAAKYSRKLTHFSINTCSLSHRPQEATDYQEFGKLLYYDRQVRPLIAQAALPLSHWAETENLVSPLFQVQPLFQGSSEAEV